MDKNSREAIGGDRKRIFQRSKRYPYYPLEISLAFVKTIDGMAGNREVAQETVLTHLGIKAATTRSFSSKVASARQFGLLEEGKALKVSDLARRILHPVSEEAKQGFLREAFTSPELYGSLVERYEHKPLPGKETLANILLTEFGITAAVKEIAAQAFLDSAQYSGAITNGVLVLPSREPAATSDVLAPESKSTTDMQDLNVTPVKTIPRANELKAELPLAGDRRATIVYPPDLTPKDAERLKALIDILVVESGVGGKP